MILEMGAGRQTASECVCVFVFIYFTLPAKVKGAQTNQERERANEETYI